MKRSQTKDKKEEIKGFSVTVDEIEVFKMNFQVKFLKVLSPGERGTGTKSNMSP